MPTSKENILKSVRRLRNVYMNGLKELDVIETQLAPKAKTSTRKKRKEKLATLEEQFEMNYATGSIKKTCYS